MCFYYELVGYIAETLRSGLVEMLSLTRVAAISSGDRDTAATRGSRDAHVALTSPVEISSYTGFVHLFIKYEIKKVICR